MEHLAWPVWCFLLLLGAVVAWEQLPDKWRDGVIESPAGPAVRAAFWIAAVLVYGSLAL